MNKKRKRPDDYNSAFKGEHGQNNLNGCIYVIIFVLVLLGINQIFE
ncbi:hypothetical protein [Flavivirga spongiicola]|uniref:Uncharacterized protein n=1 Tax=Flavivirga spongiicola TaxID=421621 RepID=A0ABU7XS22_9FLAO|nr:hypothetical protein [Flavivirga sp. MEBiC05379]MDO5978253.1 hypothetical protein [Flavivirga sp. MEBiC05379]